MSNTAERILARAKGLAPLPQTALKVLRMAARPDVVPTELTMLIDADPALTAKVLRLSNSAYYGFRRQVASLRDAGNLLGVDALVNLVLTGCAGRWFHDAGDADPADLHALWERAVANALCASLLARLSGGVDRDRAYTAGLLQDVGELVLVRHFPLEEAQVRERVRAGMERTAAERQVLGADHAELGAALAHSWGFPEVLVDALRWHHDSQRATGDVLLAVFLELSHEVVEALQTTDGLDITERFQHSAALERVGLDSAALASAIDVLAHELEQARELIEA